VKWRYRIGLGVLGLVVSMAAGLAVLLETPAGLHWAVGMVRSHSGGALAIGRVEGSRLAGPLTLDDVVMKTGDMRIAVHKLTLDWEPLALVTGTVHLARLGANGVRITVRSSGGRSGAPVLPARVSLPVGVRVDRLTASDLDVDTGTRQLHLDHAALQLRAGGSRIEIGGIAVHGPRIDLSGRLAATARGNWPVTANLDWRLRVPDYPAVTGHTRIAGRLHTRLRIDQRIAAPFAGRLNATVTHPLTRPAWNGKLAFTGLDPHALRSAWPAMRVAAVLNTHGSPGNLHVDGTVRAETPTEYAATVALDGGADGNGLRIDRLHVAIPGTRTALAARGTVRLGDQPAADVALEWSHLQWPLAPETARVSLPAGTARVSGWLGGWTLAARTRLAAPDLPTGDWSLAATGDSRHALVSRLHGDWLGGTLDARGRVSFAAPRRFQLSLRARGLKAGSIAPKIRGAVGFDLDTHGTLAPLGAQATITHVAGQLNGHPLDGNATAAYAGGTLRVSGARLSLGGNRVQAQGTWGRRVALDWRIDAPRLAAADPRLAGAVTGSGSLTGDARRPRVRGQITLRHAGWGDAVSVADGTARFDAALGGDAASSLDVELHDVASGSTQIDRLAARLEGPASAQRFVLEADGPAGRLALAARGALRDKAWKGRLDTARIALADGGTFDLRSPAALVLSRQRLALDRACLTGPNHSSVCLGGASDATGWRVDATLQRFPLHLTDPLLAGGTQLAGALDGELHGAGGNGRLAARARLQAGDVTVSRALAGERRELDFQQFSATARLDGSVATAEARVQLAKGGQVGVTARIPWKTHAEPAGRVHVVATLPDLSGLGVLSTQVANVAGRLDADLTLAGTLRAPSFNGNVRVTGGALTLARTGTRLEGLDATLQGTGNGFRLRAKTGDGRGGHLAADGELARNGNHWSLQARIQGQDFRAADMPEAHVRVSPDLRLTLAGRDIGISGSVTVPYARLRPPDFSRAVAPTPDLVVAGRGEQAAEPWKLGARLAITLGDNVRFRGYGLSARVAGAVTVNDRPGRLTTASGDLNIADGQYKAYGQDLTIQRGRLLFSGGPVDNPGLNVRATRSVGNVVAGLDVTGTLQNPRLQVFSDPPMPQSDALAYLLFGHGVQQNSGSEQSTFARAANAVGIAGGTYVAKSLGKKIGVDTVSVESASQYQTTGDQSSLFLGKYLSPRLYVSYGIGLFEPINLFRVRYELSRHWALEAESGTISGADILFNIAH